MHCCLDQEDLGQGTAPSRIFLQWRMDANTSLRARHLQRRSAERGKGRRALELEMRRGARRRHSGLIAPAPELAKGGGLGVGDTQTAGAHEDRMTERQAVKLLRCDGEGRRMVASQCVRGLSVFGGVAIASLGHGRCGTDPE
jgi:hypothetical protein